jgi:hypothetical protein
VQQDVPQVESKAARFEKRVITFFRMKCIL